MQRVLVVFRVPVDIAAVRRGLKEASTGVAGAHEVAVCLVLDAPGDSLEDGVRAQRHLTVVLRSALGQAAEDIAVFVASDRDGYRVDDCARAWGATVVWP